MRHLLLTLALTACAPTDPHADDPNRVERAFTTAEGPLADVVAGNEAFTWDLYGALVEGDGNLFFSPFSVAAALGMTSAGAGGATLDQMRDTLHVGLPATDWHPLFGALIDDLNGDKARGYRLQIANRLFGQDGVPWATAFLDTCETDWNAPFEPLDIAADPDAARGHINDWVSDQTQARIPELLTPGTVTADTRLVLVNAIYFLADWWTQFDVADTRPGTFHRLDGSSVQTPMMTVDLDAIEDHRVRAAHVDDGGGATVIRVPYEDDEVSAWIVLPDVLDGLAAVEATLDEQTFPTWAAAVGQPGDPGNAEGHFVLPKFELRWHKSLVPALQSLGMIDAFDGLLADFSPMADGGAADGYVISDVVHEAWVRVDEQGTEAAAATAVIIDDTAAPMPLVVDHPFLLAIRDDLTGSLLFVGRITDPTQPD